MLFLHILQWEKGVLLQSGYCPFVLNNKKKFQSWTCFLTCSKFMPLHVYAFHELAWQYSTVTCLISNICDLMSFLWSRKFGSFNSCLCHTYIEHYLLCKFTDGFVWLLILYILSINNINYLLQPCSCVCLPYQACLQR